METEEVVPEVNWNEFRLCHASPECPSKYSFMSVLGKAVHRNDGTTLQIKQKQVAGMRGLRPGGGGGRRTRAATLRSKHWVGGGPRRVDTDGDTAIEALGRWLDLKRMGHPA